MTAALTIDNGCFSVPARHAHRCTSDNTIITAMADASHSSRNRTTRGAAFPVERLLKRSSSAAGGARQRRRRGPPHPRRPFASSGCNRRRCHFRCRSSVHQATAAAAGDALCIVLSCRGCRRRERISSTIRSNTSGTTSSTNRRSSTQYEAFQVYMYICVCRVRERVSQR